MGNPLAGLFWILGMVAVLTLYSLTVFLMRAVDGRIRTGALALCGGFLVYALFVMGPDLFALGILFGTLLGIVAGRG